MTTAVSDEVQPAEPVEPPGTEAPTPQVARAFPPPWLRWLGSKLLAVYAGLVLLLLFAPIFVIVLFSFNKPVGKFNFVWKGFSLGAWRDPFKYPALVDAMELSIKVALVSTVFAAIIGTLVAVALVRYRFTGNSTINTFLVLPLTTPEIVLGSSLLALFLDMSLQLGFVTIVLAHIAFQVSFVAITVKARVRGFDWTLEDASMDLGADPYRTFWKVTFPLILPGIIAASMLSFALSLDDFVITLFAAGTKTTYPLYVNNATKTAFPPQINVLATMILGVSLLLLGAGTIWTRWRTRGLRT
jgi:spermidine/putrescine transport system permease protein